MPINPEGMSWEEIAEKEGCSPREVQRIAKTALQKIRGWALTGKHQEVNIAREWHRDRESR